jgi:hypothetical protein
MSMKLKILAIVGLAVVGIGAFFAAGGLPSSNAATTQYIRPGASGVPTGSLGTAGSITVIP